MRTQETTTMLTLRLNRLIGQMNGIKKMIADGAPCEDVLTQMNAVNGALHKLSFLMLDAHVRHRLRHRRQRPAVRPLAVHRRSGQCRKRLMA